MRAVELYLGVPAVTDLQRGRALAGRLAILAAPAGSGEVNVEFPVNR